MSGVDVQREITDPMQRLFRPPREYATDGDAVAALRDYVDALKDFATDDLKAGWVTVRNNSKGRTWPMVGVFVDACARARHDREMISGTRKDKHKHKRAISESWNTWLAVRHSDKAKEAAERGVSWAFKCAVLSDADPKDIDLDRLVRAKQIADALASRMERDMPIFASDGRDIGVVREPNKSALLSMRRGILDSEAQTQQEIGITGGNNYQGPDIENLVM